MGYRKFTDREGREWEVVKRHKTEWILEPTGGNPGPRRTVTPPSYERDPFEYSREELQRLVDDSGSEQKRNVKSPFKD